MMDFLIRKFLYYPEKIGEDEPLPPHCRHAREVWLASSAGDRIHGLYWPARPGRPTILFFHGNAQSVYEWAFIREDFACLQAGLLIIDYPGYGKSSGRPSEERLLAAGHCAVNWISETQNVALEQLIVFGKSLGGAVACAVAEDRPLRALILESTFRSIPAVARVLLPMVPTEWAFSRERYDSLARMARIHCPVLVIHGTADGLIPFEEGKALFEASPNPKELYAVPGAGHNNVSIVAGGQYCRTIRHWLETVNRFAPHSQPTE
jgi:hypothetical protein